LAPPFLFGKEKLESDSAQANSSAKPLSFGSTLFFLTKKSWKSISHKLTVELKPFLLALPFSFWQRKGGKEKVEDIEKIFHLMRSAF